MNLMDGFEICLCLFDRALMISNLVSQAVRTGIKMAPSLIKLALHYESSKLSHKKQEFYPCKMSVFSKLWGCKIINMYSVSINVWSP